MGAAIRFTRYVLFDTKRQKFYASHKARFKWTDDVREARVYHRASDAKRAPRRWGVDIHGDRPTTWRAVAIACVLHEDDLNE